MTRQPDPGEVPNVGVPAEVVARASMAEQQDWVASYLRRHVVSRRSALRGAGALVAALAVSTDPWARRLSRAYAADGVTVVGRRLSYGNDPRTQVRVAGELTGTPPAGRLVLDLGHDTSYGTAVPVEVRRLLSQVPSTGPAVLGAEQSFVHAALDGLAPGTRYHYRFRLPDGTVTEDAVLTTAPARGGVARPFTFTALGDHGTDVRDPRSGRDVRNAYDAGDTRRAALPATALVGRIAAQAPAFHLLAGDICYADAQGLGAPETYSTGLAQTNDYDPFAWSSYFAMIERSAASTPWMFTTGNHDMEALYGTPQNALPRVDTAHGYGGHVQRLDLPTNGPSACPSVYTFVHANVAVLSLDANDLSAEIPVNTGYSGGTQLAWVERQLAAYRADPSVDFVVCFFHHCAFSTSKTHASDGGVRDALAPLFDRYRVDLVVQAHNHQYERTNPIRGGTSTRQAPDRSTVRPAEDGTTYVLVGSGGRPRYSFQDGSTERYRGDGVSDTSAGAGPQVTDSYVWRGPGADTSPLRNPLVQEPESVDWSQVRYADYAVLAVDVVPAAPGQLTTMTLRAVTDRGTEIDRLVLERRVRSRAAAAPTAPAAPAATPTP
ncbi:MAG: hypothetical protein JWM64_929, partial [Frankiales bacterium]|nr:hypothetical protein [Frankiales bacterium]